MGFMMLFVVALLQRWASWGHNYIGHNYIGHDYVGHDYVGHNCITAAAMGFMMLFVVAVIVRDAWINGLYSYGPV